MDPIMQSLMATWLTDVVLVFGALVALDIYHDWTRTPDSF